MCKKLRTRRKRLKTCYYSANNSLRRDPQRSESVTKFSTFQNFSKSWKKTFSIGDEKLPYLGENQMKSTNLFFYNILHLLINNYTRKIFEKFFFVYFFKFAEFFAFLQFFSMKMRSTPYGVKIKNDQWTQFYMIGLFPENRFFCCTGPLMRITLLIFISKK